MIQRYKTKPTLSERLFRNPPLLFVVVMVAFFALIGTAEFISVMLGAAFDVRAG
jgi:hypothetical protein